MSAIGSRVCPSVSTLRCRVTGRLLPPGITVTVTSIGFFARFPTMTVSVARPSTVEVPSAQYHATRARPRRNRRAVDAGRGALGIAGAGADRSSAIAPVAITINKDERVSLRRWQRSVPRTGAPTPLRSRRSGDDRGAIRGDPGDAGVPSYGIPEVDVVPKGRPCRR